MKGMMIGAGLAFTTLFLVYGSANRNSPYFDGHSRDLRHFPVRTWVDLCHQRELLRRIYGCAVESWHFDRFFAHRRRTLARGTVKGLDNEER